MKKESREAARRGLRRTFSGEAVCRELRRTFSREGYYGSRLMKHRAVWGWSAALALLCTMVSYPGIWYSDSYVRVTTGGAVLNAVIKTLTGHRAPLYTGNAFTVIPSFFIALSQGLTGNAALYTFGQAFAFFAATFLLIRELNPERARLQQALFAVCPLIWGMAVYLEAGIGCVTGIAALMILLRRAAEPKARGDRAQGFLLVPFFSFVTFGYRTNALTIVPPLAFFALRRKEARRQGARWLLAMACGLAMTAGVPWLFGVHSDSTASAGIVWETLTAIQRMPAGDRERYSDYLDEIGGEGSTRVALALSTEDSAGGFMWGEDMGVKKMSAPGATATAVRKYAQLMLERPGEWFSVKADVALRSMGFQGALDLSEYNYDRWGQMAEYGMVDSPQRRAFYNSSMRICRTFGFYTLHPWVPFLVSVLLVLAEKLRKRRIGMPGAMALWLAAFYYLAYLLDTPAYDFRYFYPSLFLMMILDAALILGWIGELLPEKGRGRRKEGEGLAAAGHHSGV